MKFSRFDRKLVKLFGEENADRIFSSFVQVDIELKIDRACEKNSNIWEKEILYDELYDIQAGRYWVNASRMDFIENNLELVKLWLL